MGIQGLLPILRPVIEDAHVREFKGKKLGIDTFAWLHKAAFTCAYELGMKMKTDKYITFIMQRIHMMRSHGVEPLMVFDGCAMPAKKVTNDERGRLRARHHARGMAHAQDGNRSAATDCFQAAIRITPEMTRNLQKKLHEADVEFIVAPYEADVQLAYLSINGHVDAVVTEDSDLVVYGAKRIFLKMDKHGAGQLFCQSSLGSVESPNISSFTNAMFVHMCILAGCDMLPSMPGMGIRTAAQMLRDYKSMDRVFAAIRSRTTAQHMPEEYEETFWKCVLTFKHGRAYDPDTQKLCYLTPPPQNWDVDVEYGNDAEKVNDYLGPPMSSETARGIATGVLNPRTLEPHSPPSNSSDAAKAPFRAKRKKPAAVQVERMNRHITSYLRKDKQPSEPQPKPAESQRHARGSAPITPACSPEAGNTNAASKSSRPVPQLGRTANPFVDTAPPVCTAPAGARSKATSSTSRFFASKEKPAPAVATAVTGSHPSLSSGIVLVPESPLKSETNHRGQRHDVDEKGAAETATECSSDSEICVGNAFAGFRHVEANDTVDNSRLPVRVRKRPRMRTEKTVGNGSSFVYKTSEERRAAALEKWGYNPVSDAKPECEPGVVVSNVTCGAPAKQQAEKPTSFSSIEAFRFSGGTEYPLEASRSAHSSRTEFPLEASRRAPLSVSHEEVDDIEDLQNFAHRPQPEPLQNLPATKRGGFLLSSSNGGGGSSAQHRRPWPGAGIDDDDDDDDDDEIEDDLACPGIDIADAQHPIEGAAGRRRSSIEDGIETSDDEGVRHSRGDPSCYGENCTHIHLLQIHPFLTWIPTRVLVLSWPRLLHHAPAAY